MSVPLQNGVTYVITNVKSRTVLDLSAGDNRSVIGWPRHNGPNQRWTLVWAGNGWNIRSLSSGLFLNIDGSPENGTRLVATSAPILWHIWADQKDPTTHRIFIPNTYYNLDLYNYGDPTPGTPVTLWWTWEGLHQTWKFEQMKSIPRIMLDLDDVL
ncbi:ricin B-like lectin [Pluteus cervinus]|uniref:Ricin B-like lectin n=1 Tax=Pluteus cervinus TaxID=181527 RepID=A0ACD3A6I5_9AGAR|nr:ricin B-like lectin [Pluteus cervinus]